MKSVGFIGKADKTDLVSYVSKIITAMGKKVIMIDATSTQKTRYTVPCITPSVYYITTYEDIDVAVGFENMERLKQYIYFFSLLSYLLIQI